MQMCVSATACFNCPYCHCFSSYIQLKFTYNTSTKPLNYRLSYLCVLTVPLIGDQTKLFNVFPDNDSSDSL